MQLRCHDELLKTLSTMVNQAPYQFLQQQQQRKYEHNDIDSTQARARMMSHLTNRAIIPLYQLDRQLWGFWTAIGRHSRLHAISLSFGDHDKIDHFDPYTATLRWYILKYSNKYWFFATIFWNNLFPLGSWIGTNFEVGFNLPTFNPQLGHSHDSISILIVFKTVCITKSKKI